MSKLDAIDELLSNEDLPDLEASKSLSKIELTPSAEAMARAKSKQTAPQPEADGIERREFTRIEVLDKNLELKFSNDMQFAKQYIENISLGGLFVKTTKKHEMGQLVPIEFSIPSRSGDSGQKVFKLMGKVCRVTPQGVGLEFTNLSSEMRTELEDFVRSILPKGAQLQSKAKAASVDRIEKLREVRLGQQKQIRRLAIQGFAVIFLILVNFFAYRDLQETSEATAPHIRREVIQIGDQNVPRSEIRSISQESPGVFKVYLEHGEPLMVTQKQLEKNLPYDLRVDMRILTTFHAAKPKRSSNTSQTLRLER